jgi:tetratricopeptide (TPR) repeat protein
MIEFADESKEAAASEFLGTQDEKPAKKQPLPQDLLARVMREYYRAKSSNYFKVLGVEFNAGAEEIEEAYQKIEQQFHPDNMPDFELRPILGKLTEILDKAQAARRVLLGDRTRREYRHYLEVQERQRARDDALQAEITFKEGERAMFESDFESAKKHFEQAVKMRPDEPDYYTFLGWSTFQVAKATKNSAEIKKAKQHLNKAIAMNPDGDKAYLILGRLYAGEGNLDLARQHFDKALKVNPACEPAQKALELLGGQGSDPCAPMDSPK